MALYDPNDTLVPVQFPDGTMRQLPASLASQLGVHPDQLAPPPLQALPEYPTTTGVPTLPSPPPPPPPQRVGTLEYDPNLAGSIALQPPPRPPPPPPQKIGAAPGAPSVPYAGEIAAAPQPGAPSGPQIATPDFTAPAGTGGVPAFAPGEPGMPAAPGKPAATEAPPLTEGGLRGMGAAGAANAQLGALGAEKKAGENLADAQANQTLAFADAYEQRNAHIDRMLAQRAAEAQAKQTQIENRITDYDTATKKYADAKPIDREADHPILTAIGVFLAGIGSAWKNESGNPAIDMMSKQIDRKVAAQVQDREKQGQVLGMKRNDIEMLRQRATDSTAQYNLMIAGETERAARQIEALGARSNSDIVRANAAQGAAVLRQKAADVVGAAVMAQQGKDDRDKAFSEQLRHTRVEEKLGQGQLGLGYANLAEHKYEFGETYKLDEKKLGLEAAKLLAAGNAAKAKEVTEQGVGGVPVPVKDKDGNVSGLDYQPLKNKDGSIFTAPTKEEAVKLREQKAGVDMVNKFVNDMADGIKEHGGESSYFKSADWQTMMANKESLLFALHAAYGVEGFRPGVLEQMEKALGGVDPTSFFRNATPGLRAAAGAVNQHFTAKLRSGGFTGDDYKPFSSAGAGETITPDEQAFEDVLKKSPKQKLLDDKLPWSSGNTDLDPYKKATLDQYAAVMSNAAASEKSREQARDYLAKAQDPKLSKDPAVITYARTVSAQGGVDVATAAAPRSTEELGASSSSGVRDTSYGGKAQTQAQQAMIERESIESLRGRAVIAGDEDSRRELIRRRDAGDKAAGKALLDIVNAKR